MDLPTAVLQFLRQRTLEESQPFCVQISADFRVQQCWGDAGLFGLQPPRPGSDLREAAPLLHGQDPLRPLLLPMVNLPGGAAADVHIVPAGTSSYVAFLLVTEAHRWRQSAQQTANDVRILNHRQRRLTERQRELIAELIETKAELELRRGEAEEAGLLKSRFIASMSHEFRTPLTSVIGYSQLLAEGLEDGSPASGYARAIERAAHHLLALVDNTLDQARLETGGLVIEENDFDVYRMMDDIAAILAPLAAEKGLSFAAYVDPAVPTALRADETRLRQVLLNLLGNAVKFTDEGSVYVDVGWQDGIFRADVVDTGPGIAVEDQQRIFAAYQRAPADQNRPGAGLGLHITKRLVELMQGELELDSSPARGSRFVVRLPAAQVDVPIAPRNNAPRGVERRRPGRERRVLVAEDDRDIIQLMELYLRRAGYTLYLAQNGEEAVREALARTPDVVILDMNMPVLDGFAAARQLREAGYTRPLIALTASRADEDRRRAMMCGFSDFLAKPIQMSELVSALERYLGPPPRPADSPPQSE